MEQKSEYRTAPERVIEAFSVLIETYRNGGMRWTPERGMPRATNAVWNLPKGERPIDSKTVKAVTK